MIEHPSSCLDSEEKAWHFRMASWLYGSNKGIMKLYDCHVLRCYSLVVWWYAFDKTCVLHLDLRHFTNVCDCIRINPGLLPAVLRTIIFCYRDQGIVVAVPWH